MTVLQMRPVVESRVHPSDSDRTAPLPMLAVTYSFRQQELA